MAVRALLGLYSSVSESATYVDKTTGTGFSAAAEEKNGLALRESGELFTRSDADKQLAELKTFGRGLNRRSTTRLLARGRAQHLLGRSQAGRVYSLEQEQPHAAASGN